MMSWWWLLSVKRDVGEKGFLIASIGDCWGPLSGDPLACIVGDSLTYRDAAANEGEDTDAPLRYNPDGVVFVGEGGIM